MTRASLSALLALLLVGTVLAAATSPLTNPVFTWNTSLARLQLPWYSVSQWEIMVCTQGLTSSVGSIPGENAIVESSLSSPIYMDTITLLAKKSNSSGVTYHEIGWYVQPFSGEMGARLSLIDAYGRNTTFGTGSPSEARAWDGYEAFPWPCDARITRSCPSAEPRFVKLEWWTTNGTHDGPVQHVTSSFVNGT